MYEKGIGVSRNMHKSVAYYKKAARKDFADAQYKLGHMYLVGNEVLLKDTDKAREWLTKAADKGIPEAEYSVGLLHANGEGVPQDLAKASDYLKRAAQHGVAEAEQALSNLPAVPNYRKPGDTNPLGNPGESYAGGLQNIKQAWSGYGDVINILQNATTDH
jgi:TPR repeat protein